MLPTRPAGSNVNAHTHTRSHSRCRELTGGVCSRAQTCIKSSYKSGDDVKIFLNVHVSLFHPYDEHSGSQKLHVLIMFFRFGYWDQLFILAIYSYI